MKKQYKNVGCYLIVFVSLINKYFGEYKLIFTWCISDNSTSRHRFYGSPLQSPLFSVLTGLPYEIKLSNQAEVMCTRILATGCWCTWEVTVIIFCGTTKTITFFRPWYDMLSCKNQVCLNSMLASSGKYDDWLIAFEAYRIWCSRIFAQDDEEKEMLERELVIGHLRNKLGK